MLSDAEQITSENFAERIGDKFSELIERLGNFPAEAKKLDPRMWDVINIYNPRNQQQPEAAVRAEQAKAEPAAYRAKVGGNYVYAPQFSDASAEPLYLHPAPVPEGMVSAEKIHQFLNDREDDSYSCSLLVRDLREFVAAAEKEAGK